MNHLDGAIKKVAELMDKAPRCSFIDESYCRGCEYEGVKKCWSYRLAAFLVENGLFVSEWTRPEDELPPEGKQVLVYRDGGYALSEIIATDMLTGAPMWSYTGLGGDPELWSEYNPCSRREI